jgi:DNA-3-methyladenine glycosylase
MDPCITEFRGCASLPRGSALPSTFFARPSDDVAPDLVGKVLWRRGVGGGRLTEVEAYLPQDDPACHAARGWTRRNAAMFGRPGSIYVYISYGVHVLLNLVCEEEGVGSAVLVRSFEPLGDTQQLMHNRMAARRSEGPEVATPDGWPDGRQLSRGPGRVGQALGLHLGLNGLDLGEASGLYVIDDGFTPTVRRTTRVGVSRGDHLPLRFYTDGSEYVSHGTRTTGGHTG